MPLAKTIIESAHELHANLMFLYGGNLPDYEATGQQFYDNASSEGWHGTYYFHKEFHVLEDAGHEVWTIRQTGEYDPTALNLVISFIEKSKALQYEPSGLLVENSAPANILANVISVQAPGKVPVGEPFVVDVNASYKLSTDQNATLVAYDAANHAILSAQTIPPGSADSRTVRLVIPSISNVSQLPLFFLVLIKSGERWVQSSQPYAANITVTNLVKVTVETSIPNASVLFDGASYQTNTTGKLQIETVRGLHTVEVAPFAYLSNVSREHFVGWADSTNDTSKEVELDNDTTLTALYSTQYFVSVNSPYATTKGTGWYDVNSAATVIVSPPMVNQPSLIFDRWMGDSNESSPRIVLNVNSPKGVTANWSPLGVPNSLDLKSVGWLVVSIAIFCVLLALNLRWPKRKQAAHRAVNQ